MLLENGDDDGAGGADGESDPPNSTSADHPPSAAQPTPQTTSRATRRCRRLSALYQRQIPRSGRRRIALTRRPRREGRVRAASRRVTLNRRFIGDRRIGKSPAGATRLLLCGGIRR
mmetsp:Transcript_3785/g.7981  ORF Transcript_3785/g.7981 Transcript_3785/m.7981 type:complete len:116 (+) Transcript_3785:359-706(+)